MVKTILNIVIVSIIVLYSGILPNNILSYIPDVFTTVEVIEINKPKEEYISITKNMAKEILEKANDKTVTNIAVFNDEFATKLDSYKDTSVESKYLISMYTSSYKKAFGAFENLSSDNSVTDYIKENIISKEKFVTNEELDALKEFFRGLAWNLITKE